MTKITKQTNELAESRSVRIVWLLTATGLGASAIMMLLVMWVLRGIRTDREHFEEIRNAVIASVTDLDRLLDQGRAEADEAMEQQRAVSRNSDWLQKLVVLTESESVESGDPQVNMILPELKQQVEELSQLREQWIAWPEQNLETRHNLDEATKATQKALKALRTSIASSEGQEQLKLAVMLKDYRNAEGAEKQAVASKMLTRATPNAGLTVIETELAELAVSYERLINEEDLDALVDIKDNQMLPSLNRLKGALSHRNGLNDISRKLVPLLDEFERALLGEGFRVDGTHQTVTPGEGGVYVCRLKWLDHNNRRETLMSHADELFSSLAASRETVVEKMNQITDSLAGRAEQAMARTFTTMNAIGLLCMGAFLILAIRTASTVKSQFQAIQWKTKELADQNTAIRIIQEATIAANSSHDLDKALQALAERICDYAGWSLGHAYIRNVEMDEQQLVGGTVWYARENEVFDSLRDAIICGNADDERSVPGRALETGMPQWTNDLATDSRFASVDGLQESAIKSSFAFPIKVEGEVLAVMEFFSKGTLDSKTNAKLQDLCCFVGVQLGRVFERKLAADREESLNRELVNVSRQAGLAAVATGVLHNVGNILNSINVASNVVCEKFQNSRMKRFPDAVKLIKKHNDDLGAFLTSDEKGKMLPDFLDQLAQTYLAERDFLVEEFGGIQKNIAQVSKIIQAQQATAKLGGAREEIDVVELVEDAIRVNDAAFSRHRVTLIREFRAQPKINAERHNVLQILVNLLSNAKHAVSASENERKEIIVRVGQLDSEKVRIEVEDSGIGIAKEDMKNIFRLGYTTKRDGHGFGLHSSEFTAHEMGGELRCHSDGAGQGATFTLDLPVCVEANSEALLV